MRTEGLVDQANRYLHANCTFLLTILTFGVRSRKICEMIRLGKYENWKRKFEKKITENSDYKPRRQATPPTLQKGCNPSHRGPSIRDDGHEGPV